jgi:hypothetical protein
VNVEDKQKAHRYATPMVSWGSREAREVDTRRVGGRPEKARGNAWRLI